MNKKVILYTMKGCTPCELMYFELKRRGVDFTEVSLNDNPGLMEELIDEGYTSLPIVNWNDVHVVGFEPDLVEELLSEDA